MFKLLACLLLLVAYNAAHPGDRSEAICSINLNEMLEFVCEEMGYNKMIKRSGLDLMDYVDNLSPEPNDVQAYPLANSLLKSIYRKSGVNSLTQTRRRQRGVADECCKQRCSIQELMSYCQKPNKMSNN